MIVPDYWAEARVQQPRSKGQRQVTIRRFGWSLESQDEAQRLADERARYALQRVLSGESLHRREPKLPYNGAEGVPIREEVLARHGDVVITRNSYGAHCLNTPDVLFADVDFAVDASLLGCIFGLLFVAASIAGGIAFHSFALAVGGSLVGVAIGDHLARAVLRIRCLLSGGVEKAARSRIERFAAQHPDWRLRIYRTPAGFRVLVLHRLFAAGDPEVDTLFTALAVDPVYRQMCRNQACFRARLSPKPWRIGISQHMRPRPGVWPVSADKLALRNEWIRDYEQVAAGFAACRFEGELGHGLKHPKADRVRELHDRSSGALSGAEIA